MHGARYVGRGMESPCPMLTTLPESPRAHQPGRSLTPVLLGFLWRLHYTGMVVPAKEGCLPPSSTRIKSRAPVVNGLQHSLKGIQGRDQE